jgi:hypothetical protein
MTKTETERLIAAHLNSSAHAQMGCEHDAGRFVTAKQRRMTSCPLES